MTNENTAQLVAGVLNPADMDTSVRAQDDLYRYVNGTWLRTVKIPDDRPSAGSFMELRDGAELACRQIIEDCAKQTEAGQASGEAYQIGALYKSFMDEAAVNAAGVAPLEADVAELFSASSKDELASVMGAKLFAIFHGPIGAGVEVDLNDPERYTVWVSQAGLGLPDEAYYREEDKAALRQAYTAHIANMFALSGYDQRLGRQGADIAQAVMKLETALAAGHWDAVRCRDIEAMNNPMNWADVVSSAQGLPLEVWSSAAAKVVGEGFFNREVIVGQPDYLPKAAKVWQESELEDVRAWIIWHVLHSRAGLLSQEISTESFDFYSRKLQGIDAQRPRWKRGVSLVEGTLGEALGKLYVHRHFPAANKEAMDVLVADLLEAYRGSISQLEWMSPATRQEALAKLEQFTVKIGYPTKWRDYSSLQLSATDLVGNVRAAEAFETAYEAGKLGKPVDRDEWHMTPQTVNAYYNPVMNEIVFPAAILQAPFFDLEADDAVNYAGIGAVIGHEIGHGFDDQGSTFDGTGAVRDWWTEADRKAFEERTGALIAQYDAYVPADVAAHYEQLGQTAPHVKGALTIGENIGDLGGLGIALKAYKLALARKGIESFDQAPVIDGLSALERFFYSWARIWQQKSRLERAELLLATDPHSPNEFRCNGIVRNLDEFYETFNVVPGDELYLDPDQRVTIW